MLIAWWCLQAGEQLGSTACNHMYQQVGLWGGRAAGRRAAALLRGEFAAFSVEYDDRMLYPSLVQ
jgi:hypothetical protein